MKKYDSSGYLGNSPREDAQSHDHSIRNDQPTKILEGGDRHQRDEPGERKVSVQVTKTSDVSGFILPGTMSTS